MFDNIIRELDKLDKKIITVPINADAEGYIDKQCPSEECLFQFKVKKEDWANQFKDEAVHCPMCGHNAPAESFFTKEQIKNSEEQLDKLVRGKIHAAFKESAKVFNRNQNRNSFLRMSFEVTGNIPQHNIHPISAKNVFEQKLQCDDCKSNYAVIGSAFFCPCCGKNSVEKTFDASLNKVEISLKNIYSIRETIEPVNKDEAEIICRSIIETGLTVCVVAFQRFCEATYAKQKPTEKLPANVFQRLEDGSKLWKGIFNEGYEVWLTTAEFTRMNTLFQRRHLLSHSEGLVDEKYLKRTTDLTYKLGQRIVVREKDVNELLKLIRKIVEKIREKKTN